MTQPVEAASSIYFEPGYAIPSTDDRVIMAYCCLGKDGCGVLVLEAHMERHRQYHRDL